METTLLGDRYRLDELIGRGGMAAVWKATDTVLERSVAVKRLHTSLIADDEQLERFRREARVVARLSHPNLVHLLDRGEDDDGPYLVMELVEGENLKSRVKREGALAPDEAARIVGQVAHALAYAHAQGVIHRDIKAQNVLLSSGGHAKLADFGIARLMELDAEPGLTRTDMLIGSADYIAPEQADGAPVSARTDVYALGVVLYECLTGSLPFVGEGFVAMAMRHITQPMPDPRALVPDLPEHLALATLRAGEKDPAHRFASADDMALALEGMWAPEAKAEAEDGGTAVMSVVAADPEVATNDGGGDATTAISRTPPGRGRRRRTMALTGLACGLLATGAVIAVVLLNPFDFTGQDAPAGAAPETVQALTIAAVEAFDPEDGGGDPTDENSGDRGLAIDGDPETAWFTEFYDGSAEYGGLKSGAGLFFRLPEPALVSEMVISSPTPGAAFQILGDANAAREREVLARGTFTESPQTVALRTDEPATTYLLWITELVEAEEDRYRAGVGEVELRGVPTGAG